MTPLISVIIPVYNAETHLNRCIESVLNQTYSNLEILLVDDGSQDSSGRICDGFAQLDTRVRVTHQRNRGVSVARNIGLREFCGEYVAFVDSDDFLCPDAIEVLYDRILQDKSDLVIGKHINHYPDGGRVPKKYDWVRESVLTCDEALRHVGGEEDLPCVFWGKLFRGTVLRGLVIPDLLRGEDTCIFPFILERCQTISLTQKIVYIHYINRGSLTYSVSDRLQIDYVKAVLPVARFYLDRNMMENASYFYSASIYHAMNMQDNEPAKRIIFDSFTPRERKILIRKDLGTYVRWYAVCHSWFHKFLMSMKKVRDVVFRRRNSMEHE